MVNAADSWQTVVKETEVPPMSMKHVEFGDKDIAIINLDGKYYAISNRCGHMNASYP